METINLYTKDTIVFEDSIIVIWFIVQILHVTLYIKFVVALINHRMLQENKFRLANITADVM